MSVRAFDFRPNAINIVNIVRCVLLAARGPERFLGQGRSVPLVAGVVRQVRVQRAARLALQVALPAARRPSGLHACAHRHLHVCVVRARPSACGKQHSRNSSTARRTAAALTTKPLTATPPTSTATATCATLSPARPRTVMTLSCCLLKMSSENFVIRQMCACLHLLSTNVNILCVHSMC